MSMTKSFMFHTVLDLNDSKSVPSDSKRKGIAIVFITLHKNNSHIQSASTGIVQIHIGVQPMISTNAEGQIDSQQLGAVYFEV